MRRTKANRALTFVMAAALLIGSIHGVGAKEQSKAYEAPELTLVQGASDYDLTEGITYDSEKYTLSVTDTGNFDINVAGDYEISYALTEKESSVSETESVENTESADIIESTETVSGTETVDTTETIENTDQTPVIYALSDFLIMILSWLVKQSLRAFCFRRYSHTGIRIESAADLCYRCLDDVAMDVLYMTGNDHALEEADSLELAEIKRRWEPYINQLPDYAYLCKDLLNGKM